MIAVEQVFTDWNAEILGGLQRRFSTTPYQTLEDGASFAWAQFVRKPPPDEYALPWLRFVARNEVLRLIRATRDDVLEEQFDEERSASMSVTLDDQLEARETLRQLDGLRSGQRTALTCRLLGLSYKETQEATGRTYTWVNRHTVEGRVALRDAA